MAETVVKTSPPAEVEVTRRLQNTLQVVREDEARFKRVIEIRRLKRRARKAYRAN